MNVLTMTRARYDIYQKEVPSDIKRIALMDFVFIIEDEHIVTILKDRLYGKTGQELISVWRNVYADVLNGYTYD